VRSSLTLFVCGGRRVPSFVRRENEDAEAGMLSPLCAYRRRPMMTIGMGRATCMHGHWTTLSQSASWRENEYAPQDTAPQHPSTSGRSWVGSSGFARGHTQVHLHRIRSVLGARTASAIRQARPRKKTVLRISKAGRGGRRFRSWTAREGPDCRFARTIEHGQWTWRESDRRGLSPEVASSRREKVGSFVVVVVVVD